MSVLSTLALLMLPGALKAKVVADPEQEDLKRALADRDAEIADLRRERDFYRNELRLEREYPVRVPQPAGPDFRPPELARAQELQWQAQAQAQMAYAQQNAQMAQQDQAANLQQNLQNGLYGQALMQGAQALNPWVFCNCVPSRAQVWAANGAEA
jgi:hypothetical protein